MKKHYNVVKQSKRLHKEPIKKYLLDSFVKDDTDREDLSTRAEALKNYREAMEIIKEHKNIIRTNKKKIISFCKRTR